MAQLTKEVADMGKGHKGILATLKDAGIAALRWMGSEAVSEVICALGALLLLDGEPPLRRRQTRHINPDHYVFKRLKRTDTIESGTVLLSALVNPYMAALPENRLTQMADVHSYFSFGENSTIEYCGSEGALANGQVAMFIVPDPDRQIVTSDPQSIVDLVEEYGGIISKLSEVKKVRIPPPNRALSTQGDYTTSPKDTAQGRLYVVAFTDLPPQADGTLTLGNIILHANPKWSGKSIPSIAPVISPFVSAISLGMSYSASLNDVSSNFAYTKSTLSKAGDSSWWTPIPNVNPVLWDGITLVPGCYLVSHQIALTVTSSTTVVTNWSAYSTITLTTSSSTSNYFQLGKMNQVPITSSAIVVREMANMSAALIVLTETSTIRTYRQSSCSTGGATTIFGNLNIVCVCLNPPDAPEVTAFNRYSVGEPGCIVSDADIVSEQAYLSRSETPTRRDSRPF